jgi:sec-independent protein translocase protein TatB
MFGMGFMEIMLVAVVAIIALGPEKLPSAMVDIAKMFKKFKGGIDEAKSTLNEELKITEMKSEANKFKAQFEETKESMKVQSTLGFEDYGLKGDDLDLKSLLEDDDDEDDLIEEKKVVEKKPKKKTTPKKTATKKAETKKTTPEKAAFKTKKKKVTQDKKDETTKTVENNKEANKFKVDFEEDKSENN